MVGFNRRFAPHVQKIKELLLIHDQPKSFIMTINAGYIPADHWIQDPKIGGGRIVGEGCHFIDLLRYLAGSPIVEHQTLAIGKKPPNTVSEDKAIITLKFENGSIGVLNYFANGHPGLPKERLEVFSAGRVLQLENFRRLRSYGWSAFNGRYSWKQNKGQKECAAAFVDAIKFQKDALIPIEEVLEVSRVAIEVEQSLRA